MKQKKLYTTPRWYTYGGMFQSLFYALKLAKYFDRELNVLTPRAYLDERQEYNFPPVLSDALIDLRCKGVSVRTIRNSRWCRFLSSWISLSRKLRFSLLARILQKIGLAGLLPQSIGYTGLNKTSEMSRIVSSDKKINWGDIAREYVQPELPDEQVAVAEIKLKEVGIDPDSKWVCLYVREDSFQMRKKESGSDYLNADIASFDLAIKEILKLGYQVVRMGDPSMKPYGAHLGKGFIDYVHESIYSEEVDLYLYRHCQFWIGTMGGGRWCPTFYNRPGIMVNDVELTYSVNVLPHDVFIRKHVYSKSQQRFLSLKEQLTEIQNFPSAKYDFVNYEFHPNTPEEIYDVTKEWLDIYHPLLMQGGELAEMPCQWKSDPMEKEYHDLRVRRVKEVMYDESTGEWSYPSAEFFSPIRSSIGSEFLKSNWEYSSALKVKTEKMNGIKEKRGLRVG